MPDPARTKPAQISESRKRLMASEVLYMETGGKKRCDGCIMWIPAKDRCSIHRPSDLVKADMVCGLYVPGKAGMMGEKSGSEVTPAISGLGKGNTSCGNCYWGGESTCRHPHLNGFRIDNKGGCCNTWTEEDT